jgi:hypothetical protein
LAGLSSPLAIIFISRRKPRKALFSTTFSVTPRCRAVFLRKTVKPPHLQRMAIGRRQGRDQVEHPAQLQPRAHFLLGRRRVIGQGHDFDDLRGRCRLACAAALAPGVVDHDRTGCREQIGPPAADMAMIGQFGKTAMAS